MRRGGPRHAQQRDEERGRGGENNAQQERERITGSGNNRPGQVNASLSAAEVK